jgi:hypothetical protein
MTQHTIAHPYLGFFLNPCFRVWFLNFGLSIWNIRIYLLCLLDLNRGFLNKEMDWGSIFLDTWMGWCDLSLLYTRQDSLMQGGWFGLGLVHLGQSLLNTGARLLEGLGLLDLSSRLLEHMDTHKMLNTLCTSFVQCISGLVFLCFAWFYVWACCVILFVLHVLQKKINFWNSKNLSLRSNVSH